MNRKIDRRTTSLNLTLDVIEALDRLAQSEGLSRSYVADVLLRQLFDLPDRKLPNLERTA